MDDELEKYSGMSRYKMKLLREAKIVAIADFLACSDFQLSKMLKVKITAIEDIKDRIERKIKESDESLTLVNGSELLWYVLKEQKILITRIPQFDEIFAGGINGEHIEIIVSSLLQSTESVKIKFLLLGQTRCRENNVTQYNDDQHVRALAKQISNLLL